MPFVSVLVAIALLLLLVLVVKLDAFFALVLAAFAVGLLNGLDALSVLQSLLKGIGATMASVALILVFGAMLGKLVGESGAARAITQWLMARFGRAGAQLAMAATGLLVGLPMLYNAGFIVLIPLVYALSATTGLPIIYLGLPLASALSVTHGFLPPHPAPTFMSFVYGANVNRTLAFGLVAAIPACLIGGIGLTRALRRIAMRDIAPPAALRDAVTVSEHDLPGVGVSVLTMLAPVLLMLAGALTDIATGTANVDPARADFNAALASIVPDPRVRWIVVAMKFIGNANVALMISLFFALYTLGLRRGRTMAHLMDSMRSAVAGIAMILLIIAAGGAFSQVLRDAGVGEYVAHRAAGWRLNPLLLAFGIASLLRLAVGSATVAGMTTAGLVAPLVAASGVRPELMVLATGAGSLMFSHFNDTGFWMFKEYFNLSIPETLATWSVMEMTVAMVGMGMVLLMQRL